MSRFGLSQRETVLNHLQKHGSLTSCEAEIVYKIRRLASRIDELRKEGWPIESLRQQDATGQRYVRYKLVRKNARRRTATENILAMAA
jgi:hypothetical protein